MKWVNFRPAPTPDGVAAQLQADAGAGNVVAVRFPVPVRPVGEQRITAYFDVYLQLPPELAHSEESYMRRDLLIGNELFLTRMPNLPPARGLTFIDHPALSGLMADAEEPTHMKWNASRPRLSEDYDAAKETVTAVRQAMPRLLAFLGNVAKQRDTKALAGFFGTHAEGGPVKKGGSSTYGKGKTEFTTPPTPSTPSGPRPFRWTHGPSWDEVSSNVLGKEGQPKLPVNAVIAVAYQGLDDDAFSAYDPFDFDLANTSDHPIETTGCTITSRTGNKVVVEITASTFSMKIGGFNPNIRRRNRIDYQGAEEHAPDLIEQ